MCLSLPGILTIHVNEIPALQSPVTEKVEVCVVSARKTMQDPTVKGKTLIGSLADQQYRSPEFFQGMFAYWREVLCACFHRVELCLLNDPIEFLIKSTKICCGEVSAYLISHYVHYVQFRNTSYKSEMAAEVKNIHHNDASCNLSL